MRYKVGDKVKIREDLKEGKSYNHYTYNPVMKPNKFVTISEVHNYDNYYLVEENFCVYTDAMIEKKVPHTNFDTIKAKIGTMTLNQFGDYIYEFVSCKHCPYNVTLEGCTKDRCRLEVYRYLNQNDMSKKERVANVESIFESTDIVDEEEAERHNEIMDNM